MRDVFIAYDVYVINRSYYGKKTIQRQEIVGLEASNFGGEVLQIWNPDMEALKLTLHHL